MTFKKPGVSSTRLENGLTLLHLRTEKDPVSACHLFIPGGSSQESDFQNGLTSLRWALLVKGTATRSARTLAENIESIGASLGGGATHDYSEISCHAISDYFIPSLEIMAETIFEPAFLPDEVEKEKTALIAVIQSKKENIFAVASDALNAKLYAGHSYGRPVLGVEKSVASFTPKQVFNWSQYIQNPNHAILSVASNLSFERVRKEVMRLFGSPRWPKKKRLSFPSHPVSRPLHRSSIEKRREKFEQAYLLIGFPAPPLTSRDYLPIKILNASLGGGMSARFFQQLREKEGLAYDVGSYYPSKLWGSAFVIYIGLQASRLAEAGNKIHRIIEEISREGVPPDELDQVKNYLKGSYILDHQTNSQRAHYLGWWHTLGKTYSFDRKYIDLLDKVTADQIKKCAQILFGQNSITVEVVPKKSSRSGSLVNISEGGLTRSE